MKRLIVSFVVLPPLLAAALLTYIVTSFDGSAQFPADCAIVFGAAVHQGYDEEGNPVTSAPGPGIRRRVGTAAALYREGKVGKVFLTGGTGEGMRQSEAFVMKRVALEQGIDGTNIVTEEQARSTEENLLYTRALATDCQTIVGVSDRYHLARIEMLAWLQGWDVQTYPASGPIERRFEAKSVLREALAIVYHLVNSLSR